MKKTSFLAWGLILLTMPSSEADSTARFDDKIEQLDVEGTWMEVSQTIDSRNVQSRKTTITFRRGDYTWVGAEPQPYGMYKIDVHFDPPHLDKMPVKEELRGNVFLCIFRVSGDTLTIAYDIETHDRPKSFDQPRIVICTYRRLKD
jgi:uncharacterized protein (TIGR03067 family)